MCDDAADAGYVTASLTGVGAAGWASWNGAGTSTSPGAGGATCAPGTADYCSEYPSCGACAGACGWTTCADSVAQAVAFLDYLEASLCVNTSRVWAAGCSNGGIFTFELARDARSRRASPTPRAGSGCAQRLQLRAGGAMHLFGMWGVDDTTIPPLSNTADPTMSFDTAYSGWYYSTARNTTERGPDALGCGARADASSWWGLGDYPKLATTDAGAGCTARLDGAGGADVVECIFDAGHVCGRAYMRAPLIILATRARRRGGRDER